MLCENPRRSFRPLLLLAMFVFVPARGRKDVTGVNKIPQENPESGELGWIETLSWSPRAYIYHNFLSAEECDHIVELARPMMRRSTVVGADGKSVTDNIRTSYGTFLKRAEEPVISTIEQRLAEWTRLPLDHQEDMQILRYAVGQKYGAHYDSLDNDSPRMITVLLYLKATNLDGGETAFPSVSYCPAAFDALACENCLDQNSKWVGEDSSRGPFSQCAAGHVAAKPRKGDALLFYSLKPDGKSDPASMHAGCPVISGSKWTATKWIHSLPFHPEWLANKPKNVSRPLPDDCEDLDGECSRWAKAGECEKNPDYMQGDGGLGLGACRFSCGLCQKCAAGNGACRAANRERAGFLAWDQLD